MSLGAISFARPIILPALMDLLTVKVGSLKIQLTAVQGEIAALPDGPRKTTLAETARALGLDIDALAVEIAIPVPATDTVEIPRREGFFTDLQGQLTRLRGDLRTYQEEIKVTVQAEADRAAAAAREAADRAAAATRDAADKALKEAQAKEIDDKLKKPKTPKGYVDRGYPGDTFAMVIDDDAGAANHKGWQGMFSPFGSLALAFRSNFVSGNTFQLRTTVENSRIEPTGQHVTYEGLVGGSGQAELGARFALRYMEPTGDVENVTDFYAIYLAAAYGMALTTWQGETPGELKNTDVEERSSTWYFPVVRVQNGDFSLGASWVIKERRVFNVQQSQDGLSGGVAEGTPQPTNFPAVLWSWPNMEAETPRGLTTVDLSFKWYFAPHLAARVTYVHRPRACFPDKYGNPNQAVRDFAKANGKPPIYEDVLICGTEVNAAEIGLEAQF